MSDTAEPDLTVDQLAERVGMSVRNVREYQALGLLPAPEKRGRVVYYGAEHLARMDRIRGLRDEGFPLALIARMLETPELQGDGALQFARAVVEPFQDEEPGVIDPDDFVIRFRVGRPELIDEAIELGLIRERDDGRFEIPSPRLAAVGDAMVAIGIGLEGILDLTRQVRVHEEAVAKLFMDVYRRQVWEPFARSGAPPEALDALGAGLEALRPMALDTVLVHFKMAMDKVVAEAIEEAAAEQ